MKTRSIVLALATSVALVTGAVAAEPTLNRSQALQRLSHAEAEKRREAVVRLGDVGVMADAQALVEELRDPDEDARTLAEDALWKIWARSGDGETDAMYLVGASYFDQIPDAALTENAGARNHFNPFAQPEKQMS